MAAEKVYRGRIKYFNQEKGFGFIKRDGGQDDCFVHISEINVDQPEEGGEVSFKIRPSEKKPDSTEACDVKVIKPAATAGNKSSGNQRPVPKTRQRQNQIPASSRKTSPYKFTQRPGFTRQPPERCHEKLNENCYDIAFEVEWQALTPVAANPCSDMCAGDCCPANNDKHYQGYDKRWLLVDDKLALSPFTVKSAVANGFATLLGSCYRVETKDVEHKAEPDSFQCTGAWRRYRVAMHNSLPGILKSIDYENGEVAVIPVTEFYCDHEDLPSGLTFNEGKSYHIKFKTVSNKRIITKLSDKDFGNATEVFYYGKYRFGMNLTFGPGEFNKKHYHRFYKIKSSTPVTGRINTLNLKSLDEQKKRVYMGVFKKFFKTASSDKRRGLDGKPWHQDLTAANPNFQPGKWVYYQQFQDGAEKPWISAIGLNFQFKTAFHLHDDTVPPEQQACTDMEKLCPRCSLFGMVDETKNKSHEAVGLRGRFKASALVGPEVEPGYPHKEKVGGEDVYLRRWFERGKDKTEIAGQFLLPIQGQAKASKRDVSAYFNDEGMISGSKEYLHTDLTYVKLKNEIKRVDNCKTLKDFYGTSLDERLLRSIGNLEYTHAQRNYAMVCRDGLTFAGTLGAENCSPDEIAALLLVLEHDLAGHGFKIGLAKAMGLGSMTSTIKKIWLRSQADAPWECIVPKSDSDLLSREGGKKPKSISLADLQAKFGNDHSWPTLLGKKISGLDNALQALERVQELLNQTKDRDGRNLGYPAPGNKYWGDFEKNSVVRI